MSEQIFEDWLTIESASLIVYGASDVKAIWVELESGLKIALSRVSLVKIEEFNSKHPELLSLPAMYSVGPDKNGAAVTVWPVPDKNYKIKGVVAPQKSALFQ